MTCLTDEIVTAWVSGELGEPEVVEVERHCADCPACRGIALAMMGLVPRSEQALGAIGATIGRYRVVATIGQGAMGVVVRGHDPVLERDVAIKMINAASTTVEQREHMLREAKLLALVDHPNVVGVHDAGVIAGEVFVAMEYIDGPTLGRWMEDGPPSLAARLDVLAGAGRGIAAVHAAGVIHRDLKPDNILVRGGAPIIVDFGLARPATATSGAAGSGIAGTPRFLAPEARAGRAATERSDQYAWWTVVEEVLRDAPISAGGRARIDRAIARGHAADPDLRFATMSDAVAALTDSVRSPRAWWGVAAALAVGGAAVALWASSRAADACAPEALPAWTSARRAAITMHLAAAGIDPAVVIGAIDARAAQTATVRADACRLAEVATAEERTQAMRRELCVTETWRRTEGVLADLAAEDPQRVRSGVDDLVVILPIARCVDGAIASIPPRPPHYLAGAVAAIIAELRAIRFAPEREPRSRVGRLRAIEPRVRSLRYLPVEYAWRSDLGAELLASGDYPAARREMDAAVRLADVIGDDEGRLWSMINVLREAELAGTLDTAPLEQAADAAATRLGNDAITAELRQTEAELCGARGDHAGAIARLRDAIRLLDQVSLGVTATQVFAVNALGVAQQGIDDIAAAQVSFDRAFGLARQRFGEDAVETLVVRGVRATNAALRGDFAAAHAELAIVDARLAPLLGDDSAEVATARGFLCSTELELHAATAHATCERALATVEAAVPPGHDKRAWALGLVGLERLDAGQLAEAIAYLERADALQSSAASTRTFVRGYLAIALHRANRDVARARELAHQTLADLRDHPGQPSLMRALATAFPELEARGASR